MQGLEYAYLARRTGVIPWRSLADIYADAAAWLEAHPDYTTSVAISKSTDRLPDQVANVAGHEFRSRFGEYNGDGVGILMLCLASTLSTWGEL